MSISGGGGVQQSRKNALAMTMVCITVMDALLGAVARAQVEPIGQSRGAVCLYIVRHHRVVNTAVSEKYTHTHTKCSAGAAKQRQRI